MSRADRVKGEALMVVLESEPAPDCQWCFGCGVEERWPCCLDTYRQPTDADLAAHLRTLPHAEQVAALVALLRAATPEAARDAVAVAWVEALDRRASRETTDPAPERVRVVANPGVGAEGVRRIVATAGSGESVTPSLDYVGPGWPDGTAGGGGDR